MPVRSAVAAAATNAMKKIIISGFTLLAMFKGYSQQQTDSSAYKPTRLKIDEINLVSSYYSQDGDNAAVTGGVGSEKLTDISNAFDVTLIRYGKDGRKHTLNADVGIDYYTSASSDRIDLQANTSASYSDIRIYPSVSYEIENEQTGTAWGGGVASSSEYDYQSFSGKVNYSRKTGNKTGEYGARFQAFFDQVKMILPVELRTGGGAGTEARNTFALSLHYSQIINRNFQIMLLADIVKQDGFLSLPFHRVYFDDLTVHQEKLPDSRLKIPIGIRGSYFLGDNVIIRAYYRYYQDDWDLTSHTADIEIPVKVTPFLSFSPFYRYYQQTAVKYFKPYAGHTENSEYYTSNYDLSDFDSHFLGMGMKYTPLKGVFGIKHFHTLEMRYGHYSRSNGLSSDIVSVNIKYK